MKQVLTIAYFYSIGMLSIAGAPIQSQLNHGTIRPKLTLVAMVDGKAFFVQHSIMNRSMALSYCESLGMRLAEITSEDQFRALDQSNVPELGDRNVYWTGGMETSTILRYGWEHSRVGVDPSYIPYRQYVEMESTYFLFFRKDANGSYLQNLRAEQTTHGALCETLSNSTYSIPV